MDRLAPAYLLSWLLVSAQQTPSKAVLSTGRTGQTEVQTCPPPAALHGACEPLLKGSPSLWLSGVPTEEDLNSGKLAGPGLDIQEPLTQLAQATVQVHEWDLRNRHADAARHVLTFLESVRIADCVRIYEHCYEESARPLAKQWSCGLLSSSSSVLAELGYGNVEAILRRGSPTSDFGPVPPHGCFYGPWSRSWATALAASQNVTMELNRVSMLPMRTGRKSVHPPLPGQLITDPKLVPTGLCDFPADKKPLFVGLPGKARSLRNRWQDGSMHFVDHLSMTELLDHFQSRGVELSRHVVNLGVAEGHCIPGLMYDPANCLLLNGFGGLLFEGMERAFEPLKTLFGHRADTRLLLGMTSPKHAAQKISELSPSSPDLLKVDLDNCDVCFVEEILRRGSRPKLIHVEISDPPPPLIVRYPFHDGPGSVHRLSSLASYLQATRAYGYSLLHVEFMNAVLIRDDLAALIPDVRRHRDDEKWRVGYFCHPLRTMLRWSPSVALRRYQNFDSSRFVGPTLAKDEEAVLALAKEVFVGASVSLDRREASDR